MFFLSLFFFLEKLRTSFELASVSIMMIIRPSEHGFGVSSLYQTGIASPQRRFMENWCPVGCHYEVLQPERMPSRSVLRITSMKFDSVWTYRQWVLSQAIELPPSCLDGQAKPWRPACYIPRFPSPPTALLDFFSPSLLASLHLLFILSSFLANQTFSSLYEEDPYNNRLMHDDDMVIVSLAYLISHRNGILLLSQTPHNLIASEYQVKDSPDEFHTTWPASPPPQSVSFLVLGLSYLALQGQGLFISNIEKQFLRILQNQ